MKNYVKPTTQDPNMDLYIFHAGTNDIPLNKSHAKIADDFMKIKELLKSALGNVVISATVPLADNSKGEVTEENNFLKACVCYFLLNLYFSPNDSPSKTMKNVFCFI